MTQRTNIIIFTLFLIIIFSNVGAQSNSLDSVVVTANLTPQKKNETGKAVNIIPGSSLQGLPISSLDELLKYIPGIELQQRGSNGAQSDIIIRGGTFQQVLVLIDGVRMNDPLTGHFNGYIPLHPEDIFKIEIVKGAAAAIYGSDAIGGVIQIMTNKKTITTPKFAAKAGVKMGTYGLINTNLWLGVSKEKWKLSIAQLSNKADGEILRGTTSYFNNQSYTALFNYSLPNNWNFHLLHIQDARNFNAQNFYTQFVSDTSSEKVNSNWTQLSLSKKYSSIFFKTDVAYKKLNDQFRFNPSGTYNDNKTELFIAQSNMQWSLNKQNELVGGVQYLNKKIISNDRGNHQLSHAGAFLVLTNHLSSNLVLNESVRVDWDGNYGWVLIPQINAAWSTNKWTFRSSAGKGIRDADFTERFNNYNKVLINGGNIGNPNLQAEKSWSYEIGTDYSITSDLKWSTTLFYRTQKDLIDWMPTLYSAMPRKDNLIYLGNYALATNLSSVQTKGVEMELTYTKYWTEKNKLQFITGLIWLDTKDADNEPSFYISSHAKFLWNQQMVLKIDRWQWAINGVYKIRNKQTATAILSEVSSSYLLLNGKISYYSKRKKLNVFAEITNLFNTNYSDLLGAKMPGRWASLGIQISTPQ